MELDFQHKLIVRGSTVRGQPKLPGTSQVKECPANLWITNRLKSDGQPLRMMRCQSMLKALRGVLDKLEACHYLHLFVSEKGFLRLANRLANLQLDRYHLVIRLN